MGGPVVAATAVSRLHTSPLRELLSLSSAAAAQALWAGAHYHECTGIDPVCTISKQVLSALL
jgi:hypothetical protein